MAEEFQGGVSCWWNSPKNLFGSSPCSLGNNNVTSFDWPNHADMKTTRSSDNSAGAFSSSTSPVDWNHHQDILFHGSGKSEDNYSNIMLQDIAPLDSSMSFGGDSNSYINSFDQANGSYPLQPLTSSNISNSSSEFLRNSSLYNYNISSLLQTLFDTDSPDDQSLLDRNQPINHNYDDQMNISNQFLSSSTTNRLPFDNNNTPAAWSDIIGSSFDIPSIQSQFVTSSLTNKKRDRNEEAMVAKKVNSDQAAIKRARIETPSPLPTFKVRKEKLGDRVTALQQLVSPFGKTDTASVLHEAIEYIKFLHDQVSVLSTPYLKNRSPPLQHLQAGAKVKDPQGLTRDLKSRGLCLVPISSTFPVTAQTNADFWTPIFGESFKYA